jgi:hypothetical protein
MVKIFTDPKSFDLISYFNDRTLVYTCEAKNPKTYETTTYSVPEDYKLQKVTVSYQKPPQPIELYFKDHIQNSVISLIVTKDEVEINKFKISKDQWKLMLDAMK